MKCDFCRKSYEKRFVRRVKDEFTDEENNVCDVCYVSLTMG